MGQFHPHGDTAIYDTMVRLAQTFAVRYTLVDGQGNFGSVDGDNAAAMRYTEARLTPFAMAIMEDINADTVDFRPTYDGNEIEPVVMPSAVPNLLANGAEGIAVGMATSVPPHNVGEICDALLQLLRKPSSTVEELLEHMPGPDFPTGGVIVEDRATILKAYETGRGSLRIRAKWEREELSHGMYQIVITEIPYQVPKSRLIEKIAELFKNKKLPLLGNVFDESAEDMRIVLEPKNRSVDPEILMESLFRVTDLQSRFTLNMNVLTAQSMPKVMDLKEILESFIAHRFEVLERRTKWRLNKIAARLEILDGLLIAYLNIDEVIRIIREEDEPKQVMMKRWSLSDTQAEAILNLRLRALRKLEEIEIQREKGDLEKEKALLEAILSDEKVARKVIRDELKDIQTRFGIETEIGARRTLFSDAPLESDISIEAFIEKEPITIIYSKMGWVRAFKGKSEGMPDIKFKEGDEGLFSLNASTTDTISFFASNGRFYSLMGDRIPRGKGFGEPIRLMVDLPNDEEVLGMYVFAKGQKMLLASDIGKGFICDAEHVVASTKGGKQVLNPAKGKALICRTIAEGDDLVAVMGKNRKLLVFELSEIPEMARGQGVMMQRYKDGGLEDVKTFKRAVGLSWQIGERTRVEENIAPWLGKRASAGKLPPVGFPRSNKFGE